MHNIPLVSAVLHVGSSHHPWQAPPIERLVVCGHTPSGVRLVPGSLPGVCARPGQTLLNRPDHLVRCLPDAAAWVAVQHHHASWQSALDALASALRELGRYCDQLAAAGTSAANPLTPTVIHTYYPPDRRYGPFYVWNDDVPELRRWAAERHTAKMVIVGGSPTTQTQCFVCPDDAAWGKIVERQRAVQVARQAWLELLMRLGTYGEARADGRYAGRVEVQA